MFQFIEIKLNIGLKLFEKCKLNKNVALEKNRIS